MSISNIEDHGSYTLAEIDALRDAAREWYYLTCNTQAAELENRVRTLMIGRIQPNELKLSVAARRNGKSRSHHYVDFRKILVEYMRAVQIRAGATLLDSVEEKDLTETEHVALNVVWNEVINRKKLSNG